MIAVRSVILFRHDEIFREILKINFIEFIRQWVHN